jgi:hypothetical protein
MFNAVRSRKRGRRALADGGDADAARPCDVGVFDRVSSDEKERIHLLIQEPGGRYVNRANNIKIKQ